MLRKSYAAMAMAIAGVLLSSCSKSGGSGIQATEPLKVSEVSELNSDPQSSLSWQYWAPGGGGEIQSIFLDPKVKDRFYVLSDMEGLYRSDDKGESYKLLAQDLPQINVFGMASESQNSDRIYLGTHRMALVSDDAGDTWDVIPETLTYPIQLIDVHPTDPNIVVMALSAPDLVDLNNMPMNVPEYKDGVEHPGLVFVSHDRGETFVKSYYDETKLANSNVWQLATDVDRSALYLASERGLFVSLDAGLNWQSLALPSEYKHALGIVLSPDQQHVFAIFAKDDKHSSVFMTSADSLVNDQAQWFEINELYGVENKVLSQPGVEQVEWDGESYKNPGQRYARLAIDPRSGDAKYGMADKVRLLMGKTMKHHNSSLFMSEINLAVDGKPKAQWQRIYYEGDQKGWKTSQGSDNYIQVDSFAFTPTTWGSDAEIILENGHGVSLLDISADGFPKTGGETVLYQTKVTENNGTGGIPTWTNRGFVNTYNGDFATADNYMAAALSDQGLHESWDGGKSWIRDLRPSHLITASKSVEILKTDPEVVVLGTGYGYGAGDVPMGLWAKSLKTKSPSDQWQHLAGGIDKYTGTENNGGLPSVPKASQVNGNVDAWDYRIWAMTADSQKPERLFIGFKGHGIYVCDDVPALMSGKGKGFKKVDLPSFQIPKTSLVAHPQRENSFFVPDGNKVIFYEKGQHEVRGKFNGLVEDIYAWVHNDKTILAVAAVNRDDKSHNTYMSFDDGQNWTNVLDRAGLKKAGVPKWFETPAYPIDDPLMPFMGGLAGYKNTLFVPVGSIRNNVGVYQITFELNGNDLAIDVLNVTESMSTRHGYTRVNEGEVQIVNGEPFLIHSTRGAGVVASSLAGY